MACAFLWMDKSKSDLALKVTVNDNQIFKNWSLENISGHTNSMNVSDFFFLNCSFRNISEPKVISNFNAGHTSHQWHCHHPYCLKRLSACLLWWLPHYWSLATSDPPQSWQSQWPTWIVYLYIYNLYWIVFVFVIATGRSSTSHRSHGLCHWFH